MQKQSPGAPRKMPGADSQPRKHRQAKCWGGGDPGMLKKRYWPFSSHQMGETLTRFESDLLETVPLTNRAACERVMV